MIKYKYSRKTVEAAIEVLLCTADNNFLHRLRGLPFLSTHDIAPDTFGSMGRRGPIASLSDAAWRGVSSLNPQHGGDHAGICLEAAQLLREGWLPGDPIITLLLVCLQEIAREPARLE